MGSPTIFKGKYTGLLSSKGVLTRDNQHIENDGAFNYIKNSSAAANTDGWSTYDDGASATPVDGTGGTASNFTITRDTASKVRGETSFAISNNGADAQGEGASFDFDLNPLDYPRLMRISIEIDASDANYAAGDVGIYLVSDTGGTPVLITPSVTDIPSGKSVFESLVVTQDQADVRLCVHTQTTSTSDYTIYLANIKFTPELTVTANPKQPWTAFTADWNSSYTHGTGGSEQYFYARDGQDMLIKVVVDVGSGGSISTTLELTIPEGLTLDTSIHSPLGRGDPVGYAHLYNTGSSVYGGMVVPASSTILRVAEIDGTNAYWDGTNPTAIGSGDNFGLFARIPIAEWAGSVVTTANSRVEYAWNSSTTTTNDTTDNNYAYGPDGKEVESFAPSGTGAVVKRIQFQTPILPTDKVDLQFSVGNTGSWVNVGDVGFGSFSHDGGTNYHGVFFNGVVGSDTKMDVYFYQGPYVGRSWSTEETNGTRWRVVKSSNPLGIGTGLATATQAGALEKSFRWQTKTASNQSSTNTSMITFNNIVSGNSYRLDFRGDAQTEDNTSSMRVLFYVPSGIESTESPTIGIDASSTYVWSGDVYQRIAGSTIVKANDSSIVIGALVDGTSSLLSNISVTITELPNHVETADFT